MIFKKPMYSPENDNWAFLKEENVWSSDLFKGITVYYIVGEYFYHSEIEALGFDLKEMRELYDHDFKEKQTTDIYDHHGSYLFKSTDLGTVLKATENRIAKREKEKAFNEIEHLLNLAKGNL